MEGNYRIQVKLGDAEFSAEGPEGTVKDAYERFLVAVSAPGRPGAPSGPKPPAQEPGTASNPKEYAVERGLLDSVFSVSGEIVSLRHLPPADNPNRQADAAILILYGFKRLLNTEPVPVTRLNEALRTSGLSVDRLDRFIGVHSQYYMKGGQKSGGRYTLNNQGARIAEGWINQWFR